MNSILASLRGEQLRARAMRGSLVTFATHGASQVLRLGSNLLLTRLLFPEAFGLMSLVWVLMTGLSMLSDVGLGPAVVQHAKGDDEDFLSTAWAIQLVRGIGLWLLGTLLAWPMALLYGQPQLLQLIPITALTVVVSSLRSIRCLSASRKLALARLSIVDLSGQAANILTMLVWAYLSPTIWALVAGSWAGAITATVVSHVLLPCNGIRPRWHAEHARELVRFGRWILVSTAVTYLLGEGLRAIQGLMVSAESLSFITIAGTLAWALGDLIAKVVNAVGFPALSEKARSDPAALMDIVNRTQRLVLYSSTPIFAVITVLGPTIIDFLYDPRYQRAGVLLSVTAASSGAATVTLIYHSALLALGHVRAHTYLLSVHALLRVAGTVAGGLIAGDIGMMIGLALATSLYYLPMHVVMTRNNLPPSPTNVLAHVTLAACALATLAPMR